MMHRWLRLAPLLITALWLPLQAVASVAMPFCRHAAEQAVPAQAASPEQHCHGHEAGPESAPASTASAVDHAVQDCDGCEFCHLASAGYMPAAALASSLLPAVRIFAALPVHAGLSHIPEPPQIPPRRLS